MRIAAIFACLVASSLIVAQPPVPRKAKQADLLPQAPDALGLAITDITSMSELDRPFMRYVWVTDGERESGQAVSLVANIISRGTLISRPAPLGAGKLLVMRMDLRRYAPREKDFAEFAKTWESLAFDPRFNLLLTKGTLKFASVAFPDAKITQEVIEHETVNDLWPGGPDKTGTVFPKGTPYTWKRPIKRLKVIGINDVAAVARVPHPLLAQQIGELSLLTGSGAPLVSADYFIVRALNTIQDKGVYKDIYGGLYYGFAGIDTGAKRGTDEDVFFERLGVGSVEGGISAGKIFDSLRSDQRAATFRSKVTGSPRRIDFFRTLAGRLDTTQSLIAVTHDLRRQDVDIDTHPIANLLAFKDAARETIFEKQNGLHGYALFDGDGKRQDEAPVDVVVDRTVPDPHSTALQGAISCIACHEAEGSDGWKRFTNDVKTLLNPATRLSVFGDLSKTDNLADTLDRIYGLYQGEPERALVKGRDDYAAAVLRATGPWKGSVTQTDIVKLAAQRIVKLHRGYMYDQLDANAVLLDHGIPSRPDQALAQFNKLLGPAGQEDFRIAALRAGLSMPRTDYDLVRAFLYQRIGGKR